MRSALVTPCMLLLGMCAPAPGVHQQVQHAPAQAQAVPPLRQAQAEHDRQGAPQPDIRHGNTALARASAVARRRAESHLPGAQQGQPMQPGNRQLPEAVGLLLSLALLSGAGAAPPPAISQREID